MDEDRFLDRWSRLKRETDAATAAPEPKAAPEPEPEITPEEIAALPDVAAVSLVDDLAVFLRRGVPAALRHAALRRMWVLNPAIRDYVDDAREYAMDWNAPGGVPGGGIVTQEQARALVDRFFAARPRPDAPPQDGEQTTGTVGNASDLARKRVETPQEHAAETPEPETVARDVMPGRRHGGATPV